MIARLLASTQARVWFHRSRALVWVGAYVLTVYLGETGSVALVWFASVYANSVTDWSAAEAADDRGIMDKLEEISTRLARLEDACAATDD